MEEADLLSTPEDDRGAGGIPTFRQGLPRSLPPNASVAISGDLLICTAAVHYS